MCSIFPKKIDLTLVDKLSSETFTWEQFFRQLAMVLAAKFLMEHGFEILETLFGIGLAVTAKVSEISGTDMSEVTIDANGLIQDFLASANFTGIFKIFGQLLLMLYLIIPWALSFLMRLAISIICYSRVVEIYARAWCSYRPLHQRGGQELQNLRSHDHQSGRGQGH